MGGKKTTSKPKRNKATAGRTSANFSPTITMATRNLINMAVVGVTSGAVLLTLLAVKHF
jgi:hypothetical protein